MSGKIDLHVHTTASDGSYSPSEIIMLAFQCQLSAVAITDHDSTAGYSEADSAGARFGIEVVPGIEISTRWKCAVHILGYYFDPDSPGLRALLHDIVSERDRRNEEICKLMRKDGIRVSYSDMKSRFGSVIGRPHFAQLLTDQGMASDVQDAFTRYMEIGRPYFRPRSFIRTDHAIHIIREAGGIPVLAHPFQYRLDDSGLRQLIEDGVSAGLLGLECLYSGYSERQSRYLLDLAAHYHLLITGGSDFHGKPKPHISLGSGTGNLNVPYFYLENLKDAKQNLIMSH